MIVHDPAAHHTPTPSQLETWDASRRQDIAHQLARVEQRKAGDTATATTTAAPAQDATLAAAIQQKRAEREARRRQLATATATAAPAEALPEAGAAGAGAAAIRGSEERDAPASNTVYTVSVPTTSDTFPWYDHGSSNNDDDNNDDPQQHTYETLDAARAARVWSYPSSAEERARCEVFRDLWEKGYYMGGGSKFGGDWLVYPGACSALARKPFPPSHVCTCARRHRRSAALSLTLRCHRANLPICPLAPDGSCGARSTRHGNEEGASFVRLGPREPRSHVHQHRVGRIRVVVFREGFAVWYTVVLRMTRGRENKTSLTCAAPLPSGVV
jgi:tRNA intron endonuclease, catalytic C-terminal domain